MNQSWSSAIFVPRVFLYIGRPWINRLAVSAVLIVYYVICSYVCSSCHSFVRLFVRPSALPFVGLLNSFVPSFVSSFICSFARLIDRSFVRFLFFVRCFARPSSPIVHLEMASSLLGFHAYSSFISIDDFFHDIPSPRFVLYVPPPITR